MNYHLRKHFFTYVLWSVTENFAMNHSSLSLGIVLILLLLYFSTTAKSLVLPLKRPDSSGQGTRPSAGINYYIYSNFNASSVPSVHTVVILVGITVLRYVKSCWQTPVCWSMAVGSRHRLSLSHMNWRWVQGGTSTRMLAADVAIGV